MLKEREGRIVSVFAFALVLALCCGSVAAFFFNDLFMFQGLFLAQEEIYGDADEHHTVYLEAPQNESNTNSDNSSLQFIYNHTGDLTGTVNCTLYLDGIHVNYTASVAPDISTTAYSNSSFGEGAHWWWVNCSNGTESESSADDGYNYTFTLDYTEPILNFTPPTEGNGTAISRNWTQANITITETNLDTFKFNWNNTSYTFYDDSLVLAMNFNNNSAIGENSTLAVDISKYGNNGTIVASDWWNSSCMYRRKLTITNNNDTNLTADSPINFIIDTAYLISAGKMLSNGDDLRIIYGTTEINRTNTTDFNSTSTMIWFNAQATIANKTSTSVYYIYYGNLAAGTPDTGGITTTQNYNLTVSQGAESQIRAQYVAGKFGSALEFDGVDDYVDCGNTKSLIIRHEDFSIEAWIKTNPGKVGVIVGKSVVNLPINLYELYVNSDGTLVGHIRAKYNGNHRFVTSNSSVADGTWKHVAFTVDRDGYGKLFINGEQDGDPVDFSGVGSLHYGEGYDRQLYIGAIFFTSYGGFYHGFNGSIDEIRIYKRVLSADEIKLHYQSEFQKYNSTEWRFLNNVSNLTDGSYSYYGWANDTAGNSGSSETRTLNVHLNPTLDFNPPTPENNSCVSTNHTQVNLTITEPHLDTFKFNWNNTNYTFYDDSLVLAMNFNNNSAIRENSAKAVDISKYGNDGTIVALDWWNSSCMYRRKLTITNNNDTNLTAGSSINFIIDTAYLISAGKMLSNGDDLRIIYGTTEINRTNSTAFNSTSTMIWFNAQATIANKTSTSAYYIYYGNLAAGTPDTGGITTTQNHNLTVSQGAESQIRAQYVAGKFGSALEFDGVDDYVDCGNRESLIIRHEDFSIEAWIKVPLGGTGSTMQIVQKTQTTWPLFIYDLHVTSEGILVGHIRAAYVGGHRWVSSNSSVADGTWKHVAFTVDRDGDGKLFINGEQNGDAVNFSGVGSLHYADWGGGNWDNQLYIGCMTFTQGSCGGLCYGFKGAIDEVRIYKNRVLSADEIKIHYQSEFQKYNSTEWMFYDNVTNLIDGTYTYDGWANDTTGNSNQTETRTLTVDTTPPSYCGDGHCDPQGETHANCPSDCPYDSGGRGGTHILTSNKVTVTNKEPITRIEVNLSKSVTSPSLKVEALTTVTIPKPAGIVYRYIKMTKSNFDNSIIEDATIEFRVNDSWVENNEIVEVYMAKYENRWVKLKTELINKTENHTYYRTYTDSFSYFAVLGEKEEIIYEAGEKRCSGSNLEECRNNIWTAMESCEYGCDPATLACNPEPTEIPGKICGEGGRRCIGDELQECRDNKWTTIESCEYGCNETSLDCNPSVEPEPDDGFNWSIALGIVVLVGAVFAAAYLKRDAVQEFLLKYVFLSHNWHKIKEIEDYLDKIRPIITRLGDEKFEAKLLEIEVQKDEAKRLLRERNVLADEQIQVVVEALEKLRDEV